MILQSISSQLATIATKGDISKIINFDKIFRIVDRSIFFGSKVIFLYILTMFFVKYRHFIRKCVLKIPSKYSMRSIYFLPLFYVIRDLFANFLRWKNIFDAHKK